MTQQLTAREIAVRTLQVVRPEYDTKALVWATLAVADEREQDRRSRLGRGADGIRTYPFDDPEVR